jgi:HEPN domain-containing protein
MTNAVLARTYLRRAGSRLKTLQVLLDDAAFSDVVSEAQEIVELMVKGLLRQAGVEPPRGHDAGGLLLDHADCFAVLGRERLESLAAISARLCQESERAFYGDIDFIPTERYSAQDALQAMTEANAVVEAAAQVIPSEAGEPAG